MYRMILFSFTTIILILGIGGCSSEPAPTVMEPRHFPMDSLEGVISKDGVIFDSGKSVDGNGSVRLDTWGSVVFRLFEITDIDLEDARLIYQAKIKTNGVQGKVYLEMWCQFEGKGEYFSRDLETPVTGTTEWSTEETFFLLEKGQNPDIVKLNLVVEGSGRIWIDDLRLVSGPREAAD